MIGLARIAAPIACVGLAVLLDGADADRTGSPASATPALGTALLVASLRPPSASRARGRSHRADRARLGAQPGSSAASRGSSRTSRSRRSRSASTTSTTSCSCRSTSSRPAAAFNLLRELLAGDDRSREFGRATKPLALYLLWIGVSMTWTHDIRTGAIDLLAVLHPALDHRALGRAASVESAPREAPVRGARRDGARLRGRRLLPVRDAADLREPQAQRRQLVRGASSASTPSSTTRRSTGASSSSRSCRQRCSSCAPSRCGPASPRSRSRSWRGSDCSSRSRSRASPRSSSPSLCLCAFVWRWKALVVLVVAVVLLVGGAVAAPGPLHSLRHHGVKEINSLTSGRGSLIYNGLRHREAASRQRRRPRRFLAGVLEAHAPARTSERLAQHARHRRGGGRSDRPRALPMARDRVRPVGVPADRPNARRRASGSRRGSCSSRSSPTRTRTPTSSRIRRRGSSSASSLLRPRARRSAMIEP